MAPFRRLIGLAMLALVGGFFIWAGGNPSLFIDVPHLIFMVGVLFGATVLCFPLPQVIDAFSVLTSAEADRVSAETRSRRIAVFSRLYQLSWGAGLTLCLFRLIAMLGDLSDPASIGSGMAVSLTAPLYGAVFAEFVFNPLQQVAMNQRVIVENDNEPGGRRGSKGPHKMPPATDLPNQNGLWRGVTTVAVLLAFLLLPIVSFSEIKKEDAFSPEQEATYLRYLYGDEAPTSNAVSPRLNLSGKRLEDDPEQVLSELRARYGITESQHTPAARAAIQDGVNELRRKIDALVPPEGLSEQDKALWRLEQLPQLLERVPREEPSISELPWD